MAETNLNEAAEGAKKEITLRFSKGFVGKEFQSKSKIDCTEIRIPNQDPEDKRPWQTFVIRTENLHESQDGKSVWINLPAEGNTTLSRSVVLGETPEGKKEWGTEKTTVTNRDLKKLVEKELTLKFGKGLVGDEFQGKDKTSYREIRIPNQDPEDKRKWQTFVVKANHVHEDQFGKGMWMKVPAEGTTTLQRSVVVGEKPDGTKEWGTEKTTVTNRELKKLVEAYKERSRESALEKQAAYDTAVNEIMADPKLAEVGKAELLINLTEDYKKVSFTMDQKNEICNHAYQTKDVAGTLTLIQTMSEQMRSGNKEERPRESVMDKLAEKKSEVASQIANAEPREKDRSRENALG
ncbi:MAG: hypothetical protein HDR21_13385 [Lachnospiraceae bacterium]|nr:hypothetical protein [Lachnospiraceae bacterium]